MANLLCEDGDCNKTCIRRVFSLYCMVMVALLTLTICVAELSGIPIVEFIFDLTKTFLWAGLASSGITTFDKLGILKGKQE